MSGEDERGIRLVFDFALREGEPETRLTFTDPVAVFAAHRVSEVPAVLQSVQEATARRGLWAAGFVAYEAAPAFDPALVTHESSSDLPLAWFALFTGATPPPAAAEASPSPSPSERDGGVPGKVPAALRTGDRAEEQPVASRPGGVPNPDRPFTAGFIHPESPPALSALPICASPGRPLYQTPPSLSEGEGEGDASAAAGGGVTKAQWNQSIAAIHEAIARGETYQVNLTRRLHPYVPPDTDFFALYEQMRRAQAGTRYAAFLDIGRFQILSTSPELFFAAEGKRVITRPMKGTSKRGRWNEEDDRLAAALAQSEKDRAENVMIVDLLRNDLGKIAVAGSVRVPDLFTIERYPTVFQMTSTVEALLREGVGLPEIFRALFPCGSVTGAPKVSTMGHIASLEKGPRGVYCGAIGIVRPGGDSVFSVAIRTLVHDSRTGVAEYGVGGGITWDSTASDEWAETEDKAAVLTQTSAARPFDLLETLRLENGAYFLRDRHLARLSDSALYFSRPLNLAAITEALDSFAQEHPEGIWRVRLLVDTGGNPSVEGTAFSFSAAEPLPVILAESPIDSRDVFLFHKTTRREVYDTHRKALPEGIYDVLLWNEQGEVTEFTSANLVAEIDGFRWTPPRRAGLLAGTFREELLETSEIQERSLTPADLYAASRLWLINSVRGWVPVRLVEKQNS